LGSFLVESLIVIVLSISDLLKGISLAKHGPLPIIVGMTVGFVGGEKRLKIRLGVRTDNTFVFIFRITYLFFAMNLINGQTLVQ